MPTIKYYLRQELLPTGYRTSATQAQYGEDHLSRLRLIRSLLDSAGLSVAQVRGILALVDRPQQEVLHVLAETQEVLTPPAAAPARADVAALLRRWGWVDDVADSLLSQLGVALDAVEQAGFALPDGMLDRYARAMHDVAVAEIEALPTTSVEAAVRYVVLGTLLMEPVLLALRRLAEADASVRRFPHDAAPLAD